MLEEKMLQLNRTLVKEGWAIIPVPENLTERDTSYHFCGTRLKASA